MLLRNSHINKPTQYWLYVSFAFAYKLDFSFVSQFIDGVENSKYIKLWHRDTQLAKYKLFGRGFFVSRECRSIFPFQEFILCGIFENEKLKCNAAAEMMLWIFIVFILRPQCLIQTHQNLHNGKFIVNCNLSADKKNGRAKNCIRKWKHPYGKPLYSTLCERKRLHLFCICNA